MFKKIIILFLCALALSLQSQERIFQIRNSNNIEKRISKNTFLSVEDRVYITPKIEKLNFILLGELEHEYYSKKWLELGISGRLYWKKNSEEWSFEQSPMLFGKISSTSKKFKIDFYNRVEYRLLKNEQNHFRHRQRIKVALEPFQKSWFTVFAKEEGLYSFDDEKFNRLRMEIGISMKLINFLELNFSYLLEKKKKIPDWTTSDILAINLNFKI